MLQHVRIANRDSRLSPGFLRIGIQKTVVTVRQKTIVLNLQVLMINVRLSLFLQALAGTL